MGMALSFYIKRKTQVNSSYKWGIEEDIWIKEEGKRGGLKNLNEMFQNLYSLPNISKVIKSVFYYSSITQFMPSYQSHTLIILV
jgi:hypothetical protein